MTVCCPSKSMKSSSGLWQQCSCAVLGGLLCSSCCVVQLALNSFSVGCAGFAVLTPYRPAFLSLTAATIAGNYYRYRNKKRTALALAIASGLALTPELVALYNASKLRLPALLTASAQEKEKGSKEVLGFRVEGIKCLACCARVKQHILLATSATSCEVDFDSGTVSVGGEKLQAEEVVEAVNSLGYTAVHINSSCSKAVCLQTDTRQEHRALSEL